MITQNGISKIALVTADGAVQPKAWSLGTLGAGLSPDGLWTFDNAITDSSGNSNDLTVANGAMQYVKRYGATWGVLDSTTNLATSSQSGLDATGDVTVFLNIIVSDPVTSTYYVAKGNAGGPEASNYNWALYNSGVDPASFAYIHEYGASSDEVEFEGSVTEYGSSLDKPISLAIVRDVSANTVDWYRNGILAQSDPYTNDPTGGASTELYVGGTSAGASTQTFWIRNLFVKNSALTAAQIKSLHESTLG